MRASHRRSTKILIGGVAGRVARPNIDSRSGNVRLDYIRCIEITRTTAAEAGQGVVDINRAGGERPAVNRRRVGHRGTI